MNIGTLIEGRASSDIISVEVGQTVRDAVRILAEKRIGASRAAVQRNLAWMEARGLIREVTGQGRFRMWSIAI